MNKPKNSFWFPAKKYGWGWGFPISWQGRLFFVTWIAALFGGIAYIQSQPLPGYILYAFLLAMAFVLLAVCSVKGEKPKWRWGK